MPFKINRIDFDQKQLTYSYETDAEVILIDHRSVKFTTQTTLANFNVLARADAATVKNALLTELQARANEATAKAAALQSETL